MEFDEAVPAGLAGTNVANLAGVSVGNTFIMSNTVHWANSSGNTPNFPNPDFFPGFPVSDASETNVVYEVLTFVRFPAAVFDQMGVNNNDELRLSAARSGSMTLTL